MLKCVHHQEDKNENLTIHNTFPKRYEFDPSINASIDWQIFISPSLTYIKAL